MNLNDLPRPISRSDAWHAEYMHTLTESLAGHNSELATFDDEALAVMLDLMLKAHREETDYREMGKRMAAALLAYVNGCAIVHATQCEINGWPK